MGAGVQRGATGGGLGGAPGGSVRGGGSRWGELGWWGGGVQVGRFGVLGGWGTGSPYLPLPSLWPYHHHKPNPNLCSQLGWPCRPC